MPCCDDEDDDDEETTVALELLSTTHSPQERTGIMGENAVIFIYDRGEHQYDGPDAAAPVNHLITACLSDRTARTVFLKKLLLLFIKDALN